MANWIIVYLDVVFFTIYGECVYLMDISMLFLSFSHVGGIVKKNGVSFGLIVTKGIYLI